MNARQTAMALALAAGLVTGASADDGSGCYPEEGCYPPDHPVWIEAQKVQDASEAAWKRSLAAQSCRYLRTECHYDPGTKLGQCAIVAQCKSSPTGSVEASFNGDYGRSPEQIGRLHNCNGQLMLDGCGPSPAPDTSGKGSLPPDILDRINNPGADSDDMERRCRDAFAKSRAATSCTLTSVSADGLGLLGPAGNCGINARCKHPNAGLDILESYRGPPDDLRRLSNCGGRLVVGAC